MELKEFVELEYKDQLAQLNRSGHLKLSFTMGGYQFSLYELYDFFVELKRKLPDLHFEKMMTMHFEDLPGGYKSLVKSLS
jgi:hypothetical protein